MPRASGTAASSRAGRCRRWPHRCWGASVSYQVARLLRREDVRFVTVAGPPGAGKTRLGLAVAEHARVHFPDGVYLVDLTTSHEPRGVAPAIAHVVGTGTPSQAPDDVAAALQRALRDKRALIVLDNFEGVLPAAAMLSEMLAACPRLAVLTTSREPARATMEEVFLLPPLATPDLEHLPELPELRRVPSVALFEARARAVRPDWRLGEANARLVAEACVRLDGLPLAIELAAAWMRALSPEQLLERLSLGFLATGGRGVPPGTGLSRQLSTGATNCWTRGNEPCSDVWAFLRAAGLLMPVTRSAPSPARPPARPSSAWRH